MPTPPPGGKILSLDAVAARIRERQAAGDVVVLCHGCFDIVHPGHVRHLQHARRLGDRLLVTVTGDREMAKGEGRPLIPQELRAENLAALDCVDWVAVSDSPTAAELLETIRPNVYVKGREYENNRDPRFEEEMRIVQSHGGRVVFTSGDVVFSSTALIREMEETADPSHAGLRRLVDLHEISAEQLDDLLSRASGMPILVIGETILDTYEMCDRPDVAGEAPVMTLRPIESRRFDGGAAINARHLAAMGARPTLLTALPRGKASEALRLRLEVEGVEVQSIDVHGALLEKQRYLVGTAKVMKIDLAESLVLDAADRQQFIRRAEALSKGCETAIIADFGLGLMTSPMLREMCRRLRPHVRVMAGDVSGKRSSLLSMQGMDLLCPTEMEVRQALHNYEDGLSAVAWQVLRQTESRCAVITLGDEGLIAFSPREGVGASTLRVERTDAEVRRTGSLSDAERRGTEEGAERWTSRLHAEHVPPLMKHPIDELGCGDALLATVSLSVAAGASLGVAAVLGSLAASTQGQRLGNAVISAADLRRSVRRLVDARLVLDSSATAMLARADQPRNGAD